MKRFMAMILLVTLVLAGCASGPNTDKSKRAILVVSFGTSYSDTRELTIEATEQAFVEAYPDYDIRRAFTAQIVIDVLAERDGIEVDNIQEAMDKLKKEKYSEVIVQPTLVMNGAEYDEMAAVVEQFEEDFDKLVIGNALLTSHADYEIVIEALKAQIGELAADEAVMFMGHGTHHFADAAYSAMDLRLKNEGFDNVYMATVEGYPLFEEVAPKLEAKGINKVTLMPFMLVAGDHASNDMAGDEDDSWKVQLKKMGFAVDTYMHGLGELKEVQDLFVAHAEEAMNGEGHAE